MLLENMLRKVIGILDLEAANGIHTMRANTVWSCAVLWQRAHLHQRAGFIGYTRVHVVVLMCRVMVLHNVIGKNKLGSNIPHLTRKGWGVAKGIVQRKGGTGDRRQIQISNVGDIRSWRNRVRRRGRGSDRDALVAKRGEGSGSSRLRVGDGACRL